MDDWLWHLIVDCTVEVSNSLEIFFFVLAFVGYTIRAAREMNEAVFSSSCLQP